MTLNLKLNGVFALLRTLRWALVGVATAWLTACGGGAGETGSGTCWSARASGLVANFAYNLAYQYSSESGGVLESKRLVNQQP